MHRLLISAGLVALAASPALAQTVADPALSGIGGGAVAGGSGLRGTTDATANEIVPGDQFGFPATNAGARGGAPAKKVNIPVLRGTAIPDQYPVRLPALQAYPRAQRIRVGSGVEQRLGDAPPPPTIAALPVQPRRTIVPELNPFDPVGYGIGSTRVLPWVGQSFGYDSNPEQISSGVRGSAFSRTEGGFAVQSNWSAHELKGTIQGGYDDFFDNPRANRPDAVGVFDLRIDATRDTKIDAEARMNIDTQRPGSPELNVAVRDRPLITSVGTTLGATQILGRFDVGLHALFDRTAYDNGMLTDGTPIDLAYQNVNDYGVKLRVGYDLKPGLQPFAEIGYDRRIHDDTVDPAGYRRDSDGIGGRIGSTVAFGPVLTGTASAGYATRFYDDPRLKDLNGPTAAVSLAWAATPLTTLTVQGSTAFNETTVIGSSGIESRAIGAALSHALFRYLTVTGAVGYQQDDYVGASITERTLTASLKADYHLTRWLVLNGTLSHQRLRSTVPGSDYTQDIVMAGLRFQP